VRAPGDILSYEEMCREEGKRLQKGMNYPRGRRPGVFLMSRRKNALYTDRIEEDGKILIYEGHDIRETPGLDAKSVDQPLLNPDGSLTDNGKFFDAAGRARAGFEPLTVHVYEKLQTSIWIFKGEFHLLDAWVEDAGQRKVCKFRLRLLESAKREAVGELDNPRLIPGDVMAAVWKRDGGACRACGTTTNLHFDHIIPYSKGGTSLKAENVQVLCARHNLSKGARL